VPDDRADKLIMQNVIDALHELRQHFPGHIEAVETGTIRSYHEKHESTLHISRTLGNNGRLTSIDKSRKAIRISKDICSRAENVDWVRSNSIKYFRKLRDARFHFALLDSVNDKDIIFQEFRLIMPFMVENSILMVDDAGITANVQDFDAKARAQKGHEVWGFLKSCQADFSILATPHAHGTQIKVVLSRVNLEKIRQEL
jgi:predicted O-methyltransferase YrrM